MATLKESVAQLEANLHTAQEQKAKAEQALGNTQTELKACTARWNTSRRQVHRLEGKVDKYVKKGKYFQSCHHKLKKTRASLKKRKKSDNPSRSPRCSILGCQKWQVVLPWCAIHVLSLIQQAGE